MTKELIVRSTNLETKVAILEKGKLTEIFFEQTKNRGILGNIYKGRVTKVLPGMQAAFVDIGLKRHAFLYVSDFFDDYEEYEGLFNPAEEAAKGQNPSAGRQTEPKSSKRIVRSRRKQPPARKKTDVPTSTRSPQKTSVSASRKADRRRQADADP